MPDVACGSWAVGEIRLPDGSVYLGVKELGTGRPICLVAPKGRVSAKDIRIAKEIAALPEALKLLEEIVAAEPTIARPEVPGELFGRAERILNELGRGV